MFYIACLRTGRETRLIIRDSKEELEEALWDRECDDITIAEYNPEDGLMCYLELPDLNPIA